MLVRSGYAVDEANDLPALAGAGSQVAAVLTADGPESIADTLRAAGKGGARVPVLAYGPSATRHDLVRMLSAGAADYIEWPFDAAILTAAIRAASAGVTAWLRPSLRRDIRPRCSATIDSED